MLDAPIDAQYYTAVRKESLAERVFVEARKRIFRDFMTRMRPTSTDTILDVGVSDVLNDGANVLEQMYPFQSNITACGLGRGLAFQEEFKFVKYVRVAANEPLPFADRSFEVATSNAVLEHLGSVENQRRFIAELCRVADKIFITVPNRWFPVEHHTGIPFAHYQNSLFRGACRMAGKSTWTDERNLILMSRKLLWQLGGSLERSVAVGNTGFLMGPFSSNIYMAIH